VYFKTILAKICYFFTILVLNLEQIQTPFFSWLWKKWKTESKSNIFFSKVLTTFSRTSVKSNCVNYLMLVYSSKII